MTLAKAQSVGVQAPAQSEDEFNRAFDEMMLNMMMVILLVMVLPMITSSLQPNLKLDWLLTPQAGPPSTSVIVLNDSPKSDPPPGFSKVTNIFMDPNTGKVTIQYDDTPV